MMKLNALKKNMKGSLEVVLLVCQMKVDAVAVADTAKQRRKSNATYAKRAANAK